MRWKYRWIIVKGKISCHEVKLQVSYFQGLGLGWKTAVRRRREWWSKEFSGKEGGMWEMEVRAHARSAAFAGRRVCIVWKGDGRVFLDASSDYTIRFRARVASQGGCPGKVWGLLHTISRVFSPGQRSHLAPRGPFQPETRCALWSLWGGVIVEKMAISVLGGERCEQCFSKNWVNANKKAICQSRERLTGMGPV